MPSSTSKAPAAAASPKPSASPASPISTSVRNPNLGPKPYIARMQLRQTIGLTSRLTDAERTQFSLATKVPERRFDFRAGKLSLPDVFDLNSPGSDSHLQFLNWTVDNNGAWDYAADTRGYTYALVTAYDDKTWSARYGPRPHAHRRQRHHPRMEPPPRPRRKLRVRVPQNPLRPPPRTPLRPQT